MGLVQECRSPEEVTVAALYKAMDRQQEVVRRMSRVVRAARAFSRGAPTISERMDAIEALADALAMLDVEVAA